MSKMQNALGVAIIFRKVDPSVFPSFYGSDMRAAETSRFGVGYRWMCRFFSGPAYWDLPLQHGAWAVRVDADSHFTNYLDSDPASAVARAGGRYGYTSIVIGERRDGFPGTSLLRRRVVRVARAELHRPPEHCDWLRRERWAATQVGFPQALETYAASTWGKAVQQTAPQQMSALYFNTNFEVVSADFAHATEFRGIFDAVDRSRGFLQHRYRWDSRVRAR